MKTSVRRLCFGAIFLLAAACTVITAPVTGRNQYMMVDEETVIAQATVIHQRMLVDYRAEDRLNTNPKETARVRRIAARIIEQAKVFRPETAKWNWQVDVVTTKEVNASCMAGGLILVHTGLIRGLELTDDEIAGVIGHEVSHALAQHSRESVSQAITERFVLAGLKIGMVLGSNGGRKFDPDAGADLAATISKLMFSLPNSRAQEAEADRIGLTLMARAGFDPNGAVGDMRKIAAYAINRPPEYLSTHPDPARRVAALQAAIRSDPELSNRQSAARTSAPGALPLGTGVSSQYQLLQGSGPEDARRFAERAKSGDVNAMLALGVMLVKGAGIPEDQEAGAKIIESAANRGNPLAMNEIGYLYGNGKGVERDEVKAAGWYQKAADTGLMASKVMLGYAYFKGVGVPLDHARTAALLEPAAAAGSAWAQRMLGALYIDGDGVAKDPGKGVELLERAAVTDVQARFVLGIQMLGGRTVPADHAKGLAYLSEAAEQGHVMSLQQLGVTYRDGKYAPRDADKAIKYFERAAELGDRKSYASLGNIYNQGELVAKDAPRAFTYYQKAAEMGDEASRFVIGMMYYKGEGAEKNDTLAQFNIRLSAERGYADAQYMAGQAYAHGAVVDKDDAQAVRWFKRAAAQGHAKALSELEKRGI